MLNIAIVVIGYNQVFRIKRLLKSLNVAEYFGDQIPLIISIDNSGTNDVENYANEFVWEHGDKIVRTFEERQGLRKHILSCGKYLDTYDALIVLEDDLIVSSAFYCYAKEAIKYYQDDHDVAGISLYSHKWNVNATLPFEPALSQYDAFFMQFPQSWGQIWLKDQWQEFENWYESNNELDLHADNFPDYVANWPKTSWLKYHAKFCVEKNKYFVYPYFSYTTCFNDVGQHCKSHNTIFQVQLNELIKQSFNFPKLNKSESIVRYDAFFERQGLAQKLGLVDENFVCDLYGIKRDRRKTKYILSSAKMGYQVIDSFALELRPHENNVIKNIKGNDLFLYDTETTVTQKMSLSFSTAVNYYYRLSLGIKGGIRFCVKWIWNMVKDKLKI